MLRSGELVYFGFKMGETKEKVRKRLVIYEDESRTKEACDLRGIRLPTVEPDTNDTASWEWGTKEEFVELEFLDDCLLPFSKSDNNGQADYLSLVFGC